MDKVAIKIYNFNDKKKSIKITKLYYNDREISQKKLKFITTIPLIEYFIQYRN